MACWKKAIQLARSDWTGYKTLGVFYASQRRYDEAAEQFRTVISLTPDNTIGYNNLGACYQFTGRFRDAADSFRQSITIRPTGSAYTNLGTALYFLNRFDEAAEAFSKAIEYTPNGYLFWGNLADAYRRSPNAAMRAKTGDTYHRAIELIERELATNPSDARRRARLGYYFAASGRKEDAWAEIDQAKKLAPDDDRVLFDSALAYKLTGRQVEAEQSMQSALRNGYPDQLARKHPDWHGLP